MYFFTRNSSPLLIAKPILSDQSQLWTPKSVLLEFKVGFAYMDVGKGREQERKL